MYGIVVGVHTQELAAEAVRLPPAVEVPVSDAGRTEDDGRVRPPFPALGFCHGGGEEREGAPEAVAGEDQRPVVRDAAEGLEDVAVHPRLHLGQQPPQCGEEAFVHVACRRVGARPQRQLHALNVGVQLPVLHGCELGAAKRDDCELRARRCEHAGVQVLVVDVEHVDMPIADAGAEVDRALLQAHREGCAHPLTLNIGDADQILHTGPGGARRRLHDRDGCCPGDGRQAPCPMPRQLGLARGLPTTGAVLDTCALRELVGPAKPAVGPAARLAPCGCSWVHGEA
mmetsp:Transcript_19212/g.59440  ORF Transcript_19212/g.59440 Transcript_19212/m.59440 type:complete len:285 (+) Transcript_19212:370-1224(+)